MVTARFLRTGVLYALGTVAVLMALIALAACDATGGVGQPQAQVSPGRPTSTAQAVLTRTPRPDATATLEVFFPDDPTATPGGEEEPSSTPRPRATSTPEELPTAEPTAVPTEEPIEEPTEEPTAVVGGGYEFYVADEGGWSLEYPTGWFVSEAPPNYQFLAEDGDAFIQVTYSEGAGGLTNEELTELASNQFDLTFDDYDEQARTEQGDGSWRIDFKFSSNGVPWDAQTFVEGRQGNLYMFMLATTEEAFQAGTYDDIISYVISSYSVPQD
jgi:hypothetical protein